MFWFHRLYSLRYSGTIYFAGFSRPFHLFFTGFSEGLFTRFFLMVSLFSQISKVRPEFFKHGDTFGGGTLLGEVSQISINLTRI